MAMYFLQRFKVITLIILLSLICKPAFTQTGNNTASGAKTFKNVKYIFCYPSGYGLEFNTLQYKSVVLSEDPGQGYTCEFPNPRGVMESLIKIPHPENKQQADSLSFAKFTFKANTEIKYYEFLGQTIPVYKVITYNCYDPMCGSKHGHTRHETGYLYFNKGLGILLKVIDDMQMEILQSMDGSPNPTSLIVKIMQDEKIDFKIIDSFVNWKLK
ncbi:MAG: hypothetical protein KBH11_02020 [Bacteroidia bacterium]|nr:hypothetical protein [Bacteroidota bacterium]MBL0071872.1 hypothetical protein [Bacteroidota bacterium]MBP9081822.1 hypothetical protein [Bacteroidia bacterium]